MGTCTVDFPVSMRDSVKLQGGIEGQCRGLMIDQDGIKHAWVRYIAKGELIESWQRIDDLVLVKNGAG